MKKNVFTILVAFATALVFSTASNSFGKNQFGDVEKLMSKNNIKSFVMGLKSSNAGLVKSCIHYAGLYKITETVNPLVDILNDTFKDFTTRVSAAMSIYNIGNDAGINAIRVFSESSKEEKIREVCSAIYQDYLDNLEKYLSTNP